MLTRLWQRWKSAEVKTLTVPVDDLFVRAGELTKLWDAKLGSGFGEAKRHQVLAQLQKEFPTKSHREFALVIEAVL